MTARAGVVRVLGVLMLLGQAGLARAQCTVGRYCPVGTCPLGSGCGPCTAGYSCADGSTRQPCMPGEYSAAESGSCSECESGFYCPGGTDRQGCIPGQYSTSRSATCKACDGGYYCPGSSSKVGCDGGTHSAPGSTECSDCGPGQFSNAGAETCTNCTAGFYMANESASVCDGCASGEYSWEGKMSCVGCEATHFCPGASPRQPCNAGSSSASGASVCVLCLLGRYSSGSAQRCVNCPAGKYNSAAGGFECFACDEGHYCPGGSDRQRCPAGTQGPYRSLASCTSCLPGKFSTADMIFFDPRTVCDACDAGTYSTTRQSSCPSCPAGYDCPGDSNKRECSRGFFAGIGVALCDTCVAGQYSETRAASCLECTPGYRCLAGRYRDLCRIGTFAPAGASICMPCPSGTYSNSTDGAEFCVDCDEGYRCPGNSDKIRCAAGYFSRSGQASCSSCAAGQFSTAGSSSCLICTEGYYCSGRQDRELCSRGTFSAIGFTACNNCTAGTHSGIGQANCTNCSATTYTKAGWRRCHQCSASYFCPGGTDQMLCQAGFFSEPGAAVCTGCDPGTYAPQGSNDCTECDQGYFCPGAVDRVPCKAGKWSNDSSAIDESTCEDCGVPEACLAGGVCAEGHVSLEEGFCYGCIDDYYKEADRCKACPEDTTTMMVVAGTAFMVFALVMLKMGQAGKKRDTATAGASVTIPFSILFTELQITFRLYKLNLHWPPFVLAIVEELRQYFELDFVSLSMTAPECSFEFLTPADGYIFQQTLITAALPAFCILIGALHLLFSCFISTLAISGSRMKAYLFLVRTVPIEVANACVVAYSTMYITIMSTAADSWHCTTRVNDELHLDLFPQILCSFEAKGYPRIFVGGIVMLAVYGVGLPVLMFSTLRSRNQRAIPMYPDQVVWPESKVKIVLKKIYKMVCDALFNCITLPCVALGYLFRDKDALKNIEGDAERLAEFEAEGGLMLDERVRGGKKEKRLAKKAEREAESNFKLGQFEDPDMVRDQPKRSRSEDIPTKKKTKNRSQSFKEPKGTQSFDDKADLGQQKQPGRKLRADSYNVATGPSEWEVEGKRPAKSKLVKLKSVSFAVGGSRLKSRSSRSISSSSIKSVSEDDIASTAFAEQHHPVMSKEKKSKKGTSFKDLKRWKSADDLKTEESKVPRKTQKGERAKIMDRIKRAGATVVDSPDPSPEPEVESEPDAEAGLETTPSEDADAQKETGKLNSGSLKPQKTMAQKRLMRIQQKNKNLPWYEVDETDKDGYIFWDESTRRTLGWLYLRFQPNRWYFEFFIMLRKVLIIWITTYLGQVTDGWIALVMISGVTGVAVYLQLAMSPYPAAAADDTPESLAFDENGEERPCQSNCCGRGLYRFVRSVRNPSLNHLAMAGLICQCTTLFCGMLCQVVGKVSELTNAILGWFALSSMAFFTMLIVFYWSKALKVTIAIKLAWLLNSNKAAVGADYDVDGQLVDSENTHALKSKSFDEGRQAFKQSNLKSSSYKGAAT